MNPPETTVILKICGDRLSRVYISAETETEEIRTRKALNKILRLESWDLEYGPGETIQIYMA